MNNKPLESAILHSSFEGSEEKRLLAKFYKVKVVQGIETNSIIFPKTSVAFLIQPLCEMTKYWPPGGSAFLDTHALDRIQKFERIHRNAFILLTTAASELSPDDKKVFTAMQHEFASKNVTIYHTGSTAHCIEIINDIIQPKITSSDMIELKRFAEGDIDEEFTAKMLETFLEISPHDAVILLDGCQNLANTSNASIDQLLDCSLSVKTANMVQKFFE